MGVKEKYMIKQEIVKKGDWSHDVCSSCEEKEKPMHFFTFSKENSSMGWTLRICNNCGYELETMLQKVID